MASRKKPIDWSKRKAPPKGSPLRARYERSAIYKARQAAARKGRETRERNIQESAFDRWKKFLAERDTTLDQAARTPKFERSYRNWIISKRKLQRILKPTEFEVWMREFGRLLRLPDHGSGSIDSYITS